MIPQFSFHTGDEQALALEYVRMRNSEQLTLKTADLPDPYMLDAENILAVHYADAGAQGDAGAVEILYHTQKDVQILYGNYAYGNLDLDAVIPSRFGRILRDRTDRLREGDREHHIRQQGF